MQNTYFADVDMVYHRVPRFADDLDEIEFADMEPIDDLSEEVGVAPHCASLVVPMEPYDVVGVGPGQAIAMTPAPSERHFAPYTIGTLGDIGEDELPTDEYTVHDEEAIQAAFAG